MSLIVGENITKNWTEKDVLKNVSFTLGPNQRIGLVGPNGEGKTTLLRIIVGLEAPTEGKVSRKTGLRIGYLPQDTSGPLQEDALTLRAAMLEVFADLHRMERELHELGERMARDSGDAKAVARYGELQHAFEDRGGYAYSHKIDTVLTGLGFERDLWERPLAQLSGGQRTRGYLARLLLEEPDVLLLDEPTNHLDLQAIEWLEKWLADFRGAFIVVSHDRYFLDRVTDWTWEVSYAALESYRGGYSQYHVKRQERFKERLKQWEAQQQYIRETEDFIRRFLAGQRSKEAQGRRTRLERFMKTEAMPRPREHPRISVRLHADQRSGDFVLRLSDLVVGYEAARPLLNVERLDIQRGQRVAIVGPNGCGKTTLLKTIMGTVKPVAPPRVLGGGTPVRWGVNVTLGYLSQTHAELSPSMTAVDAVRQIDPSFSEERARNLLGGLLLSGEEVFKRIDELSGGQRSRVVLARLVLQRANVLILDEPTNHLDILSQEALQDVLADFEGTIIFVTHDRYLIKALATDIWAVADGGIVPMKGDWDQYIRWRDERLGLPPAETAQAAAARAKQERKEDFKERRRRTNEVLRMQRRLAEVERTIHGLEAEMKTLNADISRAGEAGDLARVTKLGERFAAADNELRELFAEWEKLTAKLEDG
ncbi:MAG: ABC-F family ATP-binding cassette domain-containing protein [Phycisphaerae bacterium]